MADRRGKRKVCVIGAGAAGLCAARHFVGKSEFEFTVYEQTGEIGGTWVYKEEIGLDENGLPIHSSMYQNLRTNLPVRIMNFPDFMRMETEEPSCLNHQEILSYLQRYTQHYNLHKYIEFYMKVEKVRVESAESDQPDKWSVEVKNVKTKESRNLYFDVVMVCNGHYFEPYEPLIPGLRNFSGRVSHSHSYRKPEEFSGKSIVILGAAASGIDIGIDLTSHASRVYLSHNHPRFTSDLPSNMTQVAGVEQVEGNTFHLKDGTTVTADAFIYCTGYRYSFPFLHESCGIGVDDNYVTPLYKDLINIEHPTMCIIGVPTVVVPFPMFHVQVQYFLALLNGRATLPSKSAMLEDSKLRTEKKRHAHKLADDQWEYNDSLAIAGGFDTLPPFYKAGYKAWSDQRGANLLRYKDSKFVLSPDGKSVQLIVP